MAFGSIVVRCEPRHIARILSASIDEENRSGEGEEDQEDQEKQPPRFNTGKGRTPQDPQERQVQEDAVSACDGGESSA